MSSKNKKVALDIVEPKYDLVTGCPIKKPEPAHEAPIAKRTAFEEAMLLYADVETIPHLLKAILKELVRIRVRG